MNLNQEDQGKKMSQLVAKCWADEGFKRKLLADPAAMLKAEGVELPAGLQGLSIKALENTDKVFHLVIPAKPTELSDEDLDSLQVAAAGLGGGSGGDSVPQGEAPSTAGSVIKSEPGTCGLCWWITSF